MTTSVIVNAYCAGTKEVKVVINSEAEAESYTLQDGERGEYTVYDDRKITVEEAEK